MPVCFIIVLQFPEEYPVKHLDSGIGIFNVEHLFFIFIYYS